jgi:hypothetical protein
MSVLIPKTDKEYQNWIKDHLVGFVANTYKVPSSNYMVLHTHRCRTINEQSSVAGEDGFTNKDYTKICSDSIQSLDSWLDENNFSFSKECQKCNPRDPIVLSHQEAKKLMSNFNREKGKNYSREKLLNNRELIIILIRKGISPEEAFIKATELVI